MAAPSLPRLLRLSAVALIPSLLAACGFGNPTPAGGLEEPLAPCPGTPNCVHTGGGGTGDSDDAPPFLLASGRGAVDPAAVTRALEALPRTRVVRREEGEDGAFYLHAEATSRIFRFVDDVEVRWTPGSEALVVRSASRVGRSDLGVNAQRVERLRARMQEAGILR
jgi:uncharacterized protein (DUF1499 family)